jgi:zinc transport system substrate-binding protein
MHFQIKKITALLLAACLSICVFAGCTGSRQTKKTIVCTIFPAYDWVRNLLGDRAEDYELILLIDSGVDLHSYQPSTADLAAISTCDLFVYVGGASDTWAEDTLATAQNPNLQAVNMMQTLGSSVCEEETVEGMQAEADEGDEKEYDEHVWLSLKNAEVLCGALCDALAEVDADHADTYRANCEAYQAKLDALDTEYRQTVDSAARDTLVFCDRFPFRYLTDDYGLNYYAAFVGCSAESAASFETVVFLAQKVDELSLPYVIILENSDGGIAKSVLANTKSGGQTVLTMNSLQSVTASEAAQESYLALMEENRAVLQTALN